MIDFQKKSDKIIVYTIIFFGISVLMYHVPQITLLNIREIIVFIILMTISNFFIVSYPNDSFYFSLNYPVIICTVFTLGYPLSIWIFFIGALFYLKYLNFISFIFYIAQVSLAIFAAGKYLEFFVISDIIFRRDILLMISAIFIGDLTNYLIANGLYCIKNKKSYFKSLFEIWIKRMLPVHFLFYSMGIIMVLLYRGQGFLGLVISFVPLVGIYFLLKMHNRLQEEEKRANTDALTNVRNRHSFSRWWDNVFSKINLKSISILMIDIDNFKSVNDRYGHHIGDKVLVEIVNRIKNSTRQNDYIFRYGGEEFIVILPDAANEEAQKIALRIKSDITQTPIPYLNEHPVTVSIGISYQEVLNINETSIAEKLVREADMAMYFAKQNGKDLVCIYDQMGIQPLHFS